ncbi:MAG: glycosyltransferase family 2 protein [Saprospiraceae bacterium]
MSSSAPLFSIITVCFKALEALKVTRRSIEGQTWTDYEHIVIDGGSPDGTAEWLDSQPDDRLIWISERDRGLYDAMNKGLAMARGQFVWFVNAGDQLNSPDILDELARFVQPDVDILYGDVMMVTPDGQLLGTRSEVTTQKTPGQLTWQDMKYGMVVSHQAFLPRRTLAPTYMDDNLCADIDWVINCLKKSRSTVNTHLILARFETGGLSRQRHRESLLDRFRVLGKHFGLLPNIIHHLWILIRFVLGKFSMYPKY